MGFFKDLLKPKNFLRTTVNQFDPIGKTLRDSTGNQNLGLNPIKDIKGWMSSGPKMLPQENTGGLDPSAYLGDEDDPAFGSFTDPFDVEKFYEYQDPGYAFRLQQGAQAVQNSAAAGSGALSGAALKDLLQFNQDYASTEYGNAFNRYQTQQGNIFGRLFDLARLGQSAASGVGTTGASLAGNAGQFLSNAGSAYGGGIVGAGNSIGQGLSDYWLMQRYAPRPVSAGAPGSV